MVWNGKPGQRYSLQKLNQHAILASFYNICDFSNRLSNYKGKTLFRFPLRKTPSKISREVYDVKRLCSLLDSLKEEAEHLLLFLRSVCSIEVFEINACGSISSLFKVGIDQESLRAHISTQKKFLSNINGLESGSRSLPLVESSRFKVVITEGRARNEHEWMVVHQVGSSSQEVWQLAEKQQVLPWVGVAVELNTLVTSGRIFCVLPLPVEDSIPLNVHVNGTFAVTNNRRSIKWEAHERRQDEQATWNRMLVEKCLPSCYFQLVSKLMELQCIDSNAVYNCWPDINRVQGTPWHGLLEPFYRLLFSNKKVVHTLQGRKWIQVSEGVFITRDIPIAVQEALMQCNVNLVIMNGICNQAIQKFFNASVKALTPQLARQHLRSTRLAYMYDNALRQEKLDILKYCLMDSKYSDLGGLHLIPLANESYAEFKSVFSISRSVEELCVSTPANPSSLLPDLQSNLIKMYDEDEALHSMLYSVANSGQTQLTVLNTVKVAKFLSHCNTSLWPQPQMENFWQWLQKQDLSHFCNKKIVPVKQPSGDTDIVQLGKQAGVVYISQYSIVQSNELINGLQKCGINFADSHVFKYLVHSQISQYLHQFVPDQVLDAMQSMNFIGLKFLRSEALAIQQFLSNFNFSNGRMDRLYTFSQLPLFEVLQYSDSVRYSINSLKVIDSMAIAMSGKYQFDTSLIQERPLIIDTTSHNNQHLLNTLSIAEIIYFMSEMEYLQKVAFQQIRSKKFERNNIVPFMKNVLENCINPRTMQQLTSALKDLPFINITMFKFEAPCNLFDPEKKILKALFVGEPKFPGEDFVSYLPILRQCGLKSSVSAGEILEIVTAFRLFSNQSVVVSDKKKYLKAVAVMIYLFSHPQLLNETVSPQVTLSVQLINQSRQYCWLPVASEPPDNYLVCLGWKGSQFQSCLASADASPLVIISEDLASSNLPLIVGSQAVFVKNSPSIFTQQLGSPPEVLVPAIVSNFEEVIKNEDSIPHNKLQEISIATYNYLQDYEDYCNHDTFKNIHSWVWIKKKFINPQEVAVEPNPSIELKLEPFVYVLPRNLLPFKNLFIKCGINSEITSSQILDVLQSLQNISHSEITAKKAWSIVIAIIEWLAEDTDRLNEGNVLVPVECDSPYPQLLPIEEVAYTDNEWLCKIASALDEDYNLVHQKVSHLSAVLGLTPLSDQLDITEDIFDDAGQHEPLTTRLSNILREYKDGLTIIKEMIQNADDAGATEVNILYDNRTHSTKKLLFKGMAESHGPALIVHNNSKFTDEDFENITKLAGATKANQPLKIGKFGVGFCSVYHITDVPSFVSGEWLYIFDPTLKYLKGVVRNESRPGKKIKYQLKLIANSQQLSPYQGLFGFNSSSNYNGTIFRLPFRTSASQISSTFYNDYLVDKMKRDLADNGSKLLLFLQHVKHITFSSMRGQEQVVEVSINISGSNGNVGIKKCVIKSQDKSISEHWLVATEADTLQVHNSLKPAVSSVACQLDKRNRCYQLKEIEGDVFCYLPLSAPSTGLPVHVSANFAVMSNRSGIWTETSSVMSSNSREQWNKLLSETTIPKAYCTLLKKLKEMSELRFYDFYSLWPLQDALQMKYPWLFMVKALLNIIAKEKLFYSNSTEQWLTLAESRFLPSAPFQVPGTNTSSFLSDAIKILQLPIVSLPDSHLQQLNSFCSNVCILQEYQLVSVFLEHIHLFQNQIVIRNRFIFALVLTVALSDEDSNLRSLVHNVSCIPCSPDGIKLKQASKLVDPLECKDMFDPDEAMFPLSRFYDNINVRNTLVSFGMMTNDLSWDIIISSAKTIQEIVVNDNEKAMKRVKAILKCILDKSSNSAAIVPSELMNMHFLPVLPKPKQYFINWKGEGHLVLPPNELLCNSRGEAKNTALIVGSQRAILNTNSTSNGGCGIIPQRVLKLLEIAIKPSFDEVLQHFNTLINTFESSACTNGHAMIGNICGYVYDFLEESLENPVLQQSLSQYKNRHFIWTGKAFVCPWDVAINWNYRDGPYLYKLPSMLSDRHKLLKYLGISENFNLNDILVAFKQMFQDTGDTQSYKIPKKNHSIVKDMIIRLSSMSIESSQVSAYEGDIILVDDSYTLQPVSQLSFNDAPWLPPDEECCYVHSKLNREVALALGVKPNRSRYLDKFISLSQQNFAGVPFGQREELTQRIKNILRDYPLDVTFLKEMLQNADDAKATKMRVILDKRQHKKERVLSEKWGEELQGPALLVWNDKDFSDDDLIGIQKLGLGSKRDDDETIGQFGIGFNVVYHLTDCPSFITRGNILCVFDPHCRYIPEANAACPGRQYNIDDRFMRDISDLNSSFLQVAPSRLHLPNNLNKGTLFRFPLRTEKCFQTTELLDKTLIKQHMSISKIEKIVNDWAHKIQDALLFLSHIKQFSFYVIDDHNVALKLSYEMNVSDYSQRQREVFHHKLNSYKSDNKPFIVTYPIELTIVEPRCTKVTKKWLIQNGVGDVSKSPPEQVSHDSAQPKHGIAAPLEGDSRLLGNVFCFLPLPVVTNLPVHVNGQFALSSNRCSLWSGNTEDSKTLWNKAIFEAIASSYALLLENARSYYIPESEECTVKKFLHASKSYYDLFPRIHFKRGDETVHLESEWLNMALAVVSHLRHYLLPVLVIEVPTSQGKVKAEWHPLQSDNDLNQVYFQPEQGNSIILVLKRLGMSVTCAPHSVYTFFKEVYNPPIVNPMSVFKFYIRLSATILVSNVPCLLKNTPFQTVQYFYEFLKYLLGNQCKFPESPFGYPLLLTADGELRNFNDSKVFVSKYFSIFSKCKAKFLHPDLIDLSLSHSYFLDASDQNLLANIVHLMNENFPSTMKEPVVSRKVISDDILKKLWECISKDACFISCQKEIVLKCALLPAKNQLYSGSSGVLPVFEPDSDSHCLISNSFSVIKALGVPILEGLYSPDMLRYCPRMEQYDDILNVILHVYKQNALHFTQKTSSLTKSQVKQLFSYLRQTSFHNNEEIHQKIMSLPLFKNIDGKLTTLISKNVYLWPDSDFPQEGYEKWAPIDSTVFLERNGSWQSLCKENFNLLGMELSPAQVYCKVVFPVFNKLDFNERMSHMKYIRDSLFPNLKHALQMTGEQKERAQNFKKAAEILPFLVSSSAEEKLFPVSYFVDHTVEIFNTFPESFNFLDEEYRGKEWLEFLKFIGLRTKVTTEEFLEFCVQVSNDKCEVASHVLLDYLFSTKALSMHKLPQFLSKIGSIPFVCTSDLSSLSWIAEPFATGFTKLNGAVAIKNASLLWTVRPVVNLFDLPLLCSSVRDNNVLYYLGIKTNRPVNEVFKNIINISCSRLANFELTSKYSLQPRPADATCVVDVITENIEFISSNASGRLKELSEVPFIPVNVELESLNDVMNKPVLVNPLQVVMCLRSGFEEKLSPYINALPQRLFNLFHALSQAGVTNQLEIKHLQYMLKKLHEQCKTISNPNDKTLVKNAVCALYDLLKDTSEAVFTKPLYLPSLDEKLLLSTDLVYLDRKVYRRKITQWDFSQSQYSLFFMPFFQETEFCLKLPKQLRPKRLSAVSHEELKTFTQVPSKSKLVERFQFLQELSTHQFCSDGLTKIISKLFLPETSRFTASIIELMTSLQFKTVNNLSTRVMIGSVEVVTINANYLLKNEGSNYTLYSSKDIQIDNTLIKDVAHTLCRELSHNLGEKVFSKEVIEVVTEFLGVQSKDDFKGILEKYDQEVDMHDVLLKDDTMPVPGKPISEYWRFFLDLDIDNVFYPQEWVGYEISDDNFIWAIILHRVQQEDAANALYSIQINSEDELNCEKVSKFDLYKLTRPKATLSTSQELIISSSGHREETSTRSTDEVSALKMKVYEQLGQIWLLPDKERRRGIRRLYLQYHPDKANSSEEKIYEEAFKYLKYQIARLERSQQLHDPDSNNDDETYTYDAPTSSNFNQWDESAHKRWGGFTRGGGGGGFSWSTSTTSSSFNSGRSEGFFSFQTQVNEPEAKRWIRQAKSDLKATRHLLSTSDSKVSSQVIFMAHQVMEKALKAGMYALHGLNSFHLTRHDLVVHAQALSSHKNSLLPLKNLVSSKDEAYYLDTRYPNKHDIPNAPLDKYTISEAEGVTKRAKKVFELINNEIIQ